MEGKGKKKGRTIPITKKEEEGKEVF